MKKPRSLKQQATLNYGMGLFAIGGLKVAANWCSRNELGIVGKVLDDLYRDLGVIIRLRYEEVLGYKLGHKPKEGKDV